MYKWKQEIIINIRKWLSWLLHKLWINLEKVYAYQQQVIIIACYYKN